MIKRKAKTQVIKNFKVTPKPLLRYSLAKEIQKEIRAKKISLNDLLRDLKDERRRYRKAHYGG